MSTLIESSTARYRTGEETYDAAFDVASLGAFSSTADLDILMTPSTDTLERRIGDLACLRPGWESPSSLPPSRRAVNVLYRAAQKLERGRSVIGASPHPDGYINVEWERQGVWYTAQLWADRMDLMTDDEEADEFDVRTVPLDAMQLAQFLRASE